MNEWLLCTKLITHKKRSINNHRLSSIDYPISLFVMVILKNKKVDNDNELGNHTEDREALDPFEIASIRLLRRT